MSISSVDPTYPIEVLTNPLRLIDEQESSSRAFLEIDVFRQRKGAALVAKRNIVRSILDHLGSERARGRAIDLGAGLGASSAAACDEFKMVWAREINRWSLDHVVPEYGLSDRFRLGSALAEVPGEADAIFMWHTLEHFPTAYEVNLAVAAKLAPAGAFLWQAPMYHDAYVVSSHYTFFNEHTPAVCCERIGLECSGIWYDKEHQFHTCSAREAA